MLILDPRGPHHSPALVTLGLSHAYPQHHHHCLMQPCSSAPMLVSEPHHPFAPTAPMDSYLSPWTLTIVPTDTDSISTIDTFWSLYLLYPCNISILESSNPLHPQT